VTSFDELALTDFLRRNHRAFLFCRDAAGHPIGYAMRTLTYESGGLYFATYTKSAKVGHLRADPEAACVVKSEDGASWASVRGRVEIYRPCPTEIARILARSSPEVRVPDSVAAKVRDRLLSGKRSFIRLDVEEVCAHG
jgi:nitroimidazol reductase NimA-like FMN-containing flavoprotein (pyridoxamine 5'-phosphate oxidase superfamily)